MSADGHKCRICEHCKGEGCWECDYIGKKIWLHGTIECDWSFSVLQSWFRQLGRIPPDPDCDRLEKLLDRFGELVEKYEHITGSAGKQ